MVGSILKSITSPFDRSIISGQDGDDEKLGKRIFVRFSLLAVPLSIIGMVLGYFGESSEMVRIGIVISIISSSNLIILWRTKLFSFHYSLWAFMVFFLGLIWGVFFGGFRANFGNYWVAFFPLLMAILIFDRRHMIRWFVVFSSFSISYTLLDPFVRISANEPSNSMFNNTYTVILTAALILMIINYYKREKNSAQQQLFLEQQRSENLLLNILPQQIAEALKVEERTIADHYPSASILFADLVGFTPLSARMTPQEMIELLNDIYSHFDELADRFGVEKIRTIGDSYMVASGVPVEREDHAQALAGMALEMLAYSKTLPDLLGQTIEFRIGINSGPLVAGVIGHKKFHYDVWGDTVNIASRMESHGLPSKIQVSRATRELISDEFNCQKRGTIDIKGKGNMETWFLVARK